MGDEEQRRAVAAAQVEQKVDDLRLDRHVQRRRRLVGDQQTGFADQRDGDHRALAHAAGQLMRIAVMDPGRTGDTDTGQSLDGPLPRLRAADGEMGANGLADLVADREHRIERAHRLLEDHADPAAANAPQPGVRQSDQVLPLEHRTADDMADGRRQKAEQGQAGHRLAAAAFPDDADPFARQDVEADIPGRLHLVAPGPERHTKPADGQQRRCGFGMRGGRQCVHASSDTVSNLGLPSRFGR